MGVWDGLDSAPVFERGDYLPYAEGRYIMKVIRCLVRSTQESGIMFFAEVEVAQSSHPDVPVGVKKSWGVTLASKNTAWPNIKGFCHAMMGVSASSPADAAKVAEIDRVIKGIMALATGEHNVFQGKYINLVTQPITTRPKPGQPQGGPFTVHNWSPFQYEAHNLPAVDWSQVMAMAPQAQAMADQGYGAPAPAAAPVGWGPPPAAPAYGGMPQMGPPPIMGPPGGLGPAQGPWATPQAPPAWGPPPQAPPPMRAPLPPGATISPDGKLYWAPGMAGWLPLP